jgi:hypothetical protein
MERPGISAEDLIRLQGMTFEIATCRMVAGDRHCNPTPQLMRRQPDEVGM